VHVVASQNAPLDIAKLVEYEQRVMQVQSKWPL
jgi:hypothetical protein